MLVDDFKKKYMKMKRKKLSDKDIAERLFISNTTLRNYKKKYGIMVDRLPSGRERKIKISEEELREAEARGISRMRISQRITQCGWSKERALTEPVSYARKSNVTEEELQEAEKRGISRKRVSQRITQCGWSKERALTEPIWKKGRIR